MQDAINMMVELRPLAVGLMKTPIPGKDVNAGPTFEYLPPNMV